MRKRLEETGQVNVNIALDAAIFLAVGLFFVKTIDNQLGFMFSLPYILRAQAAEFLVMVWAIFCQAKASLKMRIDKSKLQLTDRRKIDGKGMEHSYDCAGNTFFKTEGLR